MGPSTPDRRPEPRQPVLGVYRGGYPRRSRGSRPAFATKYPPSFGGQSGSPVYAYFPSTGQRIVYGIRVGGSGTATSENFATRITQGIFNDIGSWIKADGPAPNAVPNVAVGGSTGASSSDMAVVPVLKTPEASTLVALEPLTTTPGDGTIVFGMKVPNN
jgi:hypothetical protein